MAATLANEVRATGTPVYCSACFNQDPAAQHVDFDAANDRGYGESDTGIKVSMDDLILCEHCLRRGAELVGMRDARELEEELTSLRRQVDREKHRADAADEYAAKLEDAMDSRPVPVSHPRRRGRPPKDADG